MITPESGPVPTTEVPVDDVPPESNWPYTGSPTLLREAIDIASRRFFGADPGEAMAVSLEAAVTDALGAATLDVYAELVEREVKARLAVLETKLRAQLADRIEAARPLGDVTENVLIASGMTSAARIVRGER